jgi:hypothetical protein
MEAYLCGALIYIALDDNNLSAFEKLITAPSYPKWIFDLVDFFTLGAVFLGYESNPETKPKQAEHKCFESIAFIFEIGDRR